MDFYQLQWNLFKNRLKNIFLISLGIYFVVATAGYFLVLRNPDLVPQYMGWLKKSYSDLVLFRSNKLFLFTYILLTNLRASFFAVLLGLIPFLIAPVIFLIVNGFMLGFIMAAAQMEGMPMGYTLLTRILPHGIIELPALFYSISLGMYLSAEITKKLDPGRRQDSVSLKMLMLEISQSYFLIIIPLLVLAAFIEAFITPLMG
ncbi:MAG: stage II sporulation protein M [Spirochaetes bacterium]|nr:stage II sporulation protein M [Spirochaetota bacterium]